MSINTTIKEYTPRIYLRYESCLLQMYEVDKKGFISNKIQKYVSPLGCIYAYMMHRCTIKILPYTQTCTSLPHNVSALLLDY